MILATGCTRGSLSLRCGPFEVGTLATGVEDLAAGVGASGGNAG